MLGYGKAPADEVRSIIITTLVSNHIIPAVENPNYYLWIPLHTFFCGNTISHLMKVRDRFTFVVPSTFMEHIMIGVSQLSHRHNVRWYMAPPTTIPIEIHEPEPAI